eukprot:4584656-Heterocapsa_arctica.AAC.1
MPLSKGERSSEIRGQANLPIAARRLTPQSWLWPSKYGASKYSHTRPSRSIALVCTKDFSRAQFVKCSIRSK